MAAGGAATGRGAGVGLLGDRAGGRQQQCARQDENACAHGSIPFRLDFELTKVTHLLSISLAISALGEYPTNVRFILDFIERSIATSRTFHPGDRIS